MDWVGRPQNYNGLSGILQLLQGSFLDDFPLKTRLGSFSVINISVAMFQLQSFQSNQSKKVAPVLPRFCNGL